MFLRSGQLRRTIFVPVAKSSLYFTQALKASRRIVALLGGERTGVIVIVMIIVGCCFVFFVLEGDVGDETRVPSIAVVSQRVVFRLLAGIDFNVAMF